MHEQDPNVQASKQASNEKREGDNTVTIERQLLFYSSTSAGGRRGGGRSFSVPCTRMRYRHV